MANGTTHRIAAAVAIGATCLHAERDQQEKTIKPLAGAVLSSVLTNLPDVVEPALHPNHRQFFHSYLFAAALAWGAYKVYKWEAETPVDKVARFVLLVGAGAYLVHLALDAGTPKSLPLVGKL